MAEKKQVSTGVIAGVAAVAIALVGFFGFRTMSGPSMPTVPSPTSQYKTADQLALKCGGDFSKLTAAEQKSLDDMTLGHGAKYVQSHYAALAGKTTP